MRREGEWEREGEKGGRMGKDGENGRGGGGKQREEKVNLWWRNRLNVPAYLS